MRLSSLWTKQKECMLNEDRGHIMTLYSAWVTYQLLCMHIDGDSFYLNEYRPCMLHTFPPCSRHAGCSIAWRASSLPCWPSRPSPRLFPLSSWSINQKCIKSKVGPIKGRIPPRTLDKAYLINKCFSIRARPAPSSLSLLLPLISNYPPPESRPTLRFAPYQQCSTFSWWHEAHVPCLKHIWKSEQCD